MCVYEQCSMSFSHHMEPAAPEQDMGERGFHVMDDNTVPSQELSSFSYGCNTKATVLLYWQ